MLWDHVSIRNEIGIAMHMILISLAILNWAGDGEAVIVIIIVLVVEN